MSRDLRGREELGHPIALHRTVSSNVARCGQTKRTVCKGKQSPLVQSWESTFDGWKPELGPSFATDNELTKEDPTERKGKECVFQRFARAQRSATQGEAAAKAGDEMEVELYPHVPQMVARDAMEDACGTANVLGYRGFGVVVFRRESPAENDECQ